MSGPHDRSTSAGLPVPAMPPKGRAIQRVVMPVDRDQDVLKLYVEGRVIRGDGTATAEELADKANAGRARAGSAGSYDGIIAGRRSLVVPVGHRVSFCTYFNAFPAGYWRRWTAVEQVRLHVRMRGEAMVIVYRSTAKGHTQRVRSFSVDSGHLQDHEVVLSLGPFIDGGWYWFDIIAGDRHAVLESADWCTGSGDTTAARPATSGTVTIGITTFNRPDFCVEQLQRLAAISDVLDQVLIIDQGTDKVAAHPDFVSSAAALREKLQIIDQGNLGGSGGFARAMDETVRAGLSDYLLLLDDDVVTEPEGVLRAIAFADFCTSPTLVGGHMFSLYARSVLHTFGETVDPHPWQWGAAPNTHPGHDFAHQSLQRTEWLHRRVDVDYNAWWMCLIPTDVVRKLGLAMPFFIKWDDAEYGLRARDAGFPTVTLPGVAVWHMPFHDKDDTIDWQSYFHARNRLVAALIHSPYERGGSLIKDSFTTIARHSMAMQYSAAGLMLDALEDVLSGPDHMHAGIATKLAEIRAFRDRFPDARARSRVDDFPEVRRHRPLRKGKLPMPPRGSAAEVRSTLVNLVRQLRPVDVAARRNPQLAVPHVDQHWALLAQLDSALVSSADGSKVAWYQREPARFRALMRRNLELHSRILRQWPALAETYRGAATELTSAQRWRQTFESCAPSERR